MPQHHIVTFIYCENFNMVIKIKIVYMLECRGRAHSSSGVVRKWVRIPAWPVAALVSLSKTLNHNCFVLRMGRKAVGPMCCVMHVKEPRTLIVKEKGFAPVFLDSRLEHPAGWIFQEKKQRAGFCRVNIDLHYTPTLCYGYHSKQGECLDYCLYYCIIFKDGCYECVNFISKKYYLYKFQHGKFK